MRMFVKRLVSILGGAAIVVLAACAPLLPESPTAAATDVPTSTSGIPITGGDLENTQWTLISFREGGSERPPISGTALTLAFMENGQAGGSGGCNSYSAQYQAGDGSISFGPVTSTKMACTPEGVMVQEQMFFNALQASSRYEVADDTLRVWYADGQNTLTFSKATSLTPVQPTTSPTVIAPTLVSPSATPGNGNSAERIVFSPGATSASRTGTLAAAGSKVYVLRALAGQTLSIDLSFTEGRAILTVWGEDGDVLLSDHAEASSFERSLPKTQDYFIRVLGKPDGNTSYTMTVSIPPIQTGIQRIEFSAGSTSATVTGQLGAADSDQYVLRAQAGQGMNIDLSFNEGAAILLVWGADGTVLLTDHAEASSFQGLLPTTQDYYIMVRGQPEGTTSYTMTVSIPPGR